MSQKIPCRDPSTEEYSEFALTSLKGFCHVTNLYDVSPNVTMLNETFLMIKKYHETSPISIIYPQMSLNITMLNETL